MSCRALGPLVVAAGVGLIAGGIPHNLPQSPSVPWQRLVGF